MRNHVAEKERYEITDGLAVEVEVFKNDYQLNLGQLFQMATRINKKRSFLFVSKVLGKHLAVQPQIPVAIGQLLAFKYAAEICEVKDGRIKQLVEAFTSDQDVTSILEDIEKNPLTIGRPVTVMGFAETATALGHAFFSALDVGAKFIHTTREDIKELTSVIHFEEEHSHATSHRVYALDANFFEDDSEVVLVDDEITTGKTAVNIIRTMKEKYPHKYTFTVVSILDWRSKENRQQFIQLERDLQISIRFVSLIEGYMKVDGAPVMKDSSESSYVESNPEVELFTLDSFLQNNRLDGVTSISTSRAVNSSAYVKSTGRFGLTREEDMVYMNQAKELAEQIRNWRKGQKTLVIGTGEFMFVPMKLAAGLGGGVYFQSTTRSPIYAINEEAYTIRNKFSFDSPENEGTNNFLYNIGVNQYDEIMIIVERMISEASVQSLIEQLKRTEIPYITVIVMTNYGSGMNAKS